MYMAADLENINGKRLSFLKIHSTSVYVWGKATKFNMKCKATDKSHPLLF